ncbi:MAG: rhamnulokinase, partial [Spirochaetales bacterium]|nr:rhamnulokinase [Spirochaetales bacterium]
EAIGDLERVLGVSFASLNIIGGGSKNEILNQWAADATGLTVLAGPVEATALGNLIVQSWATGELASLQEGRDLIRTLHKVKTFTPRS